MQMTREEYYRILEQRQQGQGMGQMGYGNSMQQPQMGGMQQNQPMQNNTQSSPPAKQGWSIRNNPITNLAKGFAEPFVQAAVTGAAPIQDTWNLALGNMNAVSHTAEGYNVPGFGQVKPNKIGTDVSDQIGGSGPDNRTALEKAANPFGNQKGPFGKETLNTLGTGAQIASSVAGGEGAAGLAEQGGKGLIGEAAVQGAKEGGMIGATNSFGGAVKQNDATFGKVLSSTVEGGLTGAAIGGVAGAVSPFLSKEGQEARIAMKSEKETSDLAEYLSPKADKELSVNAIKKGSKGFEDESYLSKGKVKVTQKDLEVANSVKHLDLKPGQTIKNIDKLNANISDLAENQVTPFLKENPAIYNENLLQGKFNELKQNKLGFLKTDEQSSKIYDSVINQAQEIAQNQPTKDMYGLWQSRIEFDNWVEKNFGDKALKDDAARSARDEALKGVRSSMNDFIAEHTPDTKFKDLMSQLSNSYTARENIAEKAYAEGATKISKLGRLAKSHPTLTKVGKVVLPAVAGGEFVKHFLP